MSRQLLNATKRRKSLYDPTYKLFRTHEFADGATNIATGTIFPDRTKPLTVGVTVKRTGATPTGVIFELGSSTTGLAIWFAAADGKIYAAAGEPAAGGVTLEGTAPPIGQIVRIVFSVIPSSGKARLWFNGKLVAAGTGGLFTNGWADGADGAVGGVDTSVTPRVPVADRISLASAVILSPVSAYHNQRPRQFFEVA